MPQKGCVSGMFERRFQKGKRVRCLQALADLLSERVYDSAKGPQSRRTRDDGDNDNEGSKCFLRAHGVPGMVLSTSPCGKQLHRMRAVISISQMGKLRPQKVK